MSKYINPYTDFGFKKLFGEEANKDLREPIFEKAFHEAEIAAMTSGEYDNYQKSLMKYIEIREVVNTAVSSAVKTAKNDEAKSIAKEMKIDGVNYAKIMKYTGLSENEIDNL